MFFLLCVLLFFNIMAWSTQLYINSLWSPGNTQFTIIISNLFTVFNSSPPKLLVLPYDWISGCRRRTVNSIENIQDRNKHRPCMVVYLYSCEQFAPPGIANSPFSFHSGDVIKYPTLTHFPISKNILGIEYVTVVLILYLHRLIKLEKTICDKVTLFIN